MLRPGFSNVGLALAPRSSSGLMRWADICLRATNAAEIIPAQVSFHSHEGGQNTESRQLTEIKHSRRKVYGRRRIIGHHVYGKLR